MPYTNISAANLALIKTKINEIKALLPFLVNLTDEERQTILKMGDKSFPFPQNQP